MCAWCFECVRKGDEIRALLDKQRMLLTHIVDLKEEVSKLTFDNEALESQKRALLDKQRILLVTIDDLKEEVTSLRQVQAVLSTVIRASSPTTEEAP